MDIFSRSAVPLLLSSYSSSRPGALLPNVPGVSVTRDGFFAASIGQSVHYVQLPYIAIPYNVFCSVVCFLFLFNRSLTIPEVGTDDR